MGTPKRYRGGYGAVTVRDRQMTKFLGHPSKISGPSIPLWVRWGKELSEGYIIIARAQVIDPFRVISHSPSPIPCPVLSYLTSKMSEKDGVSLQKELHDSPPRRTSLTEVDLNKNLSAK